MRPRTRGQSEQTDGRVRYACVGLGYIAQAAVLPAFSHAANSELTALVSSNPVKLKRLGRKYRVRHLFTYDRFEECLSSGQIDAVYIALPNSKHREYAVRAANAGVHVLCEKPMAVTGAECREMIEAARASDVRLMVAYRLHFEAANLKAVEIARSGRLGDLRIFNSLFTMSVKPDNVRLRAELGGGTLYDIGIYCINAARYLFRDEPYEVLATSATGSDERFESVEEMMCATLRFPGERLASITTSFGAADASSYELVGTKGRLRVDPAYEWVGSLKHELHVRGKTANRTFPKRDPFSPQLIYFSDCVRRGVTPEPSGEEGLADVRIIEALYASARKRQPVRLGAFRREQRPGPRQELRRPPAKKPKLVQVTSPSENPGD